MKTTTHNKGKKNYLLIGPRVSPYPFPDNFEFMKPPNAPSVPHGLAYISSSLKSVHEGVYNLNLEFCSGTVQDEVRQAISDCDADVVMTTGICRHFTMIKEVVDSAKAAKNDIKIIIGGGVISSNPEVAMSAFEHGDIGVIGEGEYTIREIAHALENNLDLDPIKGIIYKKGNNYKTTPHRGEIKDLDSILWPDFEGLQYEKQLKYSSIMSIVCGRSCPYHCTFCSHPCGPTYRERSVESIIDELEYLIERYEARNFYLIGEGLFANRKKARKLCEALSPHNIEWSCNMHASFCEPDILELMRDSGCYSVGIGVESTNDHILKNYNKKVRFSQIERALENLRSAHIAICGSLICGDELDDQSTIEKNLQWWRQNRQYPIDILILYLYPGSELYKRAVASGKIKEEIAHLKSNCPPLNVSQLTEYQYNDLYMKISTEKAFHTFAPPSYKIMDTDIINRKTQLHYLCECGHEDKSWIRGILISDELMCPVCRRVYTIPFHTNYSIDFSEVERKHRNIAFWGIGLEMQLLLDKLGIESRPDFLLVDKDQKKQGLRFKNQTIQAPDILRSKQVSAVVITPIAKGANNDSIEAEIMSHGVSEIVCFDSILSPPETVESCASLELPN